MVHKVVLESDPGFYAVVLKSKNKLPCTHYFKTSKPYSLVL